MADTKIASPACPLCGETMVRRKRRQDGAEFWGCPRYPRCRGVRQMDGEAAAQPRRIDPDLQLQASVRRRELTQARTATAHPHGSAAGRSARAEYEHRREAFERRRQSARPWILLTGAAGVAVGIAMMFFGPTWTLFGWSAVFLAVVSTVIAFFVLPRGSGAIAAGVERHGVGHIRRRHRGAAALEPEAAELGATEKPAGSDTPESTDSRSAS